MDTLNGSATGIETEIEIATGGTAATEMTSIESADLTGMVS